jgi:geranylgeranyl reductase family protein
LTIKTGVVLNLYDALIIGAGPAGSYAAYRLSALGHKVAVLEEHGEIGQPVCCTGLISRECVERFNIPEELILKRANSAKLFAPSGNFLSLVKEGVQAYVVNRAGFDASWAQKARGEGAEIFLNSRAKDVKVLADRIRVYIEQEGVGTHLEGKMAVIATGFPPKFSWRLSCGRGGDFIMGVQTEVDINEVDEIEIYFGQEIAPGFFAWLVPTSKDKALAGLFSHRNPGLYLRNFLSRLSRQGKITAAGNEFSYGGIPLSSPPKTYRERIVAIGDVAGQVKPTTGGGIYYGLLCADTAVEISHQALSSSDFSEKLFSQYQRTWKERLGRELRIGRLARRLYNRLNDKQIDDIFHLIKANGLHEALLQSPHLSFDWHGELILQGLRSLALWQHLPPLSFLFEDTRRN